ATKHVLPNASVTKSDTARALPRFGLRSLFDLFQAGISVADPIPRLIDLGWIHWNRAGNFFASRYQAAFILHRFAALDGKLPMMPEFVESVVHGLSFGPANPATTHGVIKHPVTILPRSVVLVVRDVVQHRSIAIFAFKGSTHDRPEVPWNRCAIDNRTDRCHPHCSVWISVAKLSQKRHRASVRIPLRYRFAVVMSPFGCPRNRLIDTRLSIRAVA